MDPSFPGLNVIYTRSCWAHEKAVSLADSFSGQVFFPILAFPSLLWNLFFLWLCSYLVRWQLILFHNGKLWYGADEGRLCTIFYTFYQQQTWLSSILNRKKPWSGSVFELVVKCYRIIACIATTTTSSLSGQVIGRTKTRAWIWTSNLTIFWWLESNDEVLTLAIHVADVPVDQ